MAQKTKEELKNQSKTLLENEGNEKVDWIDTFATEVDLETANNRLDNVEKVSKYTIASSNGYPLEVIRTGHIVTLAGTHITEENIEYGADMGIVLPEYYRPMKRTVLLDVIWASGREQSHIDIDKDGVIKNVTGRLIPKGADLYISGTWYSEAPLD